MVVVKKQAAQIEKSVDLLTRPISRPIILMLDSHAMESDEISLLYIIIDNIKGDSYTERVVLIVRAMYARVQCWVKRCTHLDGAGKEKKLRCNEKKKQKGIDMVIQSVLATNALAIMLVVVVPVMGWRKGRVVGHKHRMRSVCCQGSI